MAVEDIKTTRQELSDSNVLEKVVILLSVIPVTGCSLQVPNSLTLQQCWETI